MPLALAFAASVVTVIVIGMIVERLTVNPVRSASPVTLIIITVGVSIVLRGLALLVWGATPYSLQEFTSGGPLNLFGAVVSLQRLWVMGTAAVVLGALYFLLDRTMLGKALRACSINQNAASLMGISPSQMSLFTFALAAALGAIAGIVIAPLTLATYDMGLMLGLKGFVAAVIGGLVSAPGAVVGGLLLGVLESLAAGLVSSGLKDAIAFIVLLIVLIVRSENIIARSAGALQRMNRVQDLLATLTQSFRPADLRRRHRVAAAGRPQPVYVEHRHLHRHRVDPDAGSVHADGLRRADLTGPRRLLWAGRIRFRHPDREAGPLPLDRHRAWHPCHGHNGLSHRQDHLSS